MFDNDFSRRSLVPDTVTRRAALGGAVAGMMTLAADRSTDPYHTLRAMPIVSGWVYNGSAFWRWRAGDGSGLVDGQRAVASLRVPASRGVWLRDPPQQPAPNSRVPYATFDDVTGLLADTRLSYGPVLPGTPLRAGGFDYVVAPREGAPLATSNGVGLYPVGDVVRPEQFGVMASGSDELDGLQRVLDFIPGRAELRISRVHRIRPHAARQSLRVASHSRIVFDPGGKIENLPHRALGYEMLLLHDVQDVTICGAFLDGRRDLNAASGGEWGNGIQIIGGVDAIRIVKPVTNNMWGDGIYVGEDPRTARNPLSVEIWEPHADNCRRQGMSITSAHRCVVHHPVWTNTHGTPPSAGLDIEPNADTCVLDDIRIISPRTSGNAGAGVTAYLGMLRRASRPINIVISDHVSDRDHCGALFARSGTGGSYVRGGLAYRRARIEQPGISGIVVEDWDVRGAHLNIDRPVIRDPNAKRLTADRARTGITLFVPAEGDADTIGNVVISEPSITTASGSGRMERYIYIQNEKHPNAVDRVSIVNPVALQGAAYNWIEGRVRWEDDNNMSTKAHADPAIDWPIDKWHFAGSYSNKGASGIVTFTLAGRDAVAGWPDVRITAEAAYPLRLRPDPLDRIGDAHPGQSLLLAPGGRLILRRTPPHGWGVASLSGRLIADRQDRRYGFSLGSQMP